MIPSRGAGWLAGPEGAEDVVNAAEQLIEQGWAPGRDQGRARRDRQRPGRACAAAERVGGAALELRVRALSAPLRLR